MSKPYSLSVELERRDGDEFHTLSVRGTADSGMLAEVRQSVTEMDMEYMRGPDPLAVAFYHRMAPHMPMLRDMLGPEQWKRLGSMLGSLHLAWDREDKRY